MFIMGLTSQEKSGSINGTDNPLGSGAERRVGEETLMPSDFEGRKLVVVGGSSGMGKETAHDVVDGGGSAVIIGRDQVRVDETVAPRSKWLVSSLRTPTRTRLSW
jgi:hypothetical protein